MQLVLTHQNLLKKGDLSSHKSKVKKLEVNKLETIANDLRKLKDVIDNDVYKKTVI